MPDSSIEWVIEENYDDRPFYGPPCGVGPQQHTWTLTIDEGTRSLSSGCEECDAAVMDPCGGDDVFMRGSVKGRMVFDPDCSNLGGWHGMERCDCGWTWWFDPTEVAPDAQP